MHRRTFLGLTATSLALPRIRIPERAAAPAFFPKQDPVLVQEMVGVSHNNPARVRELLKTQPALARAAVDWGYGDWESALGASSHVGNREIAEMLIAAGARPSIFSATMLGQVDVVRAFVTASPGVQGILGPHSITLLSHARAGGEQARPVFEFLQEIGGADNPPATIVIEPTARDRYLGTYTFGSDPTERLIIGLNGQNLTIQRPGFTARNIRAIATDEFFPVGGEAVRIRFSGDAAVASRVAVFDPGLIVTATR